MLRPVTACRCVQLRSRIMDVNPMGYVDAALARVAKALFYVNHIEAGKLTY